MCQVTVAELTVALIHTSGGRAGGQPAWRSLTGLAHGDDHDRDDRDGHDADVSAALRTAEESPGDLSRVQALAGALVRRAQADTEFMDGLRRWMSAGASPDRDDRGDRDDRQVANVIGGAARITGPSVQARDIQGGIHVHTAPGPRPPVPRQLLPVPAHFTDREQDMARLDGLRRGGRPGASQVLVVSGAAGVGKTTLASRWLWGLRDEVPDGQLYVDLRGYAPEGPVRPSEVLSRFLRAFGAGPVPVELSELAAMWRSLTAELRVAVMLDNAMTAAQVRPLLPGTSGGSSASLAIVTSRHRLTGLVADGAAFHHLGVLAPNAAVELLSRSVGRTRVEREPGAAREVVSLCACLPLAVCVAAARLAARPRQPVTAMAEALAQDRARLALLSMDGEAAVQTALDESYRALPTDAARLYRCLGVLPVDVFDGSEAAAACALSPAETERLLDTLVEVNLVEDVGPDPSGTDRYRLHDLVRLHAGQRASGEETGEARREAVRRLLDWYLATATDAEALLTPSHRTLGRDYAFPHTLSAAFTGSSGALTWLDVHQSGLMAAVRAAAGAGLDTTAWQLVDAMWPLFLRLRPYVLWIEAHEIGLSSARRSGHRAAESRMLTSGGGGLLNAGRPDDALVWFTQALRQAREEADRTGESQALHGLGQAHQLAERFEQAGALFAEALSVREAIGYRRGAALSRLCLGDVALATGSPGEAIAHLSLAHSELVAARDRYDAARALALLGRAHGVAGDHEAAEHRLREALGEFRTAGSVHWRARTLEMLGQTAQDRADAESARELYEQSLALYVPVSVSDTRRLRDRLQDLAPAADPPP